LPVHGVNSQTDASASEAGISWPGAFAGTPEFASPEQFVGVGVDIHSDLYSLGVALSPMGSKIAADSLPLKPQPFALRLRSTKFLSSTTDAVRRCNRLIPSSPSWKDSLSPGSKANREPVQRISFCSLAFLLPGYPYGPSSTLAAFMPAGCLGPAWQ
jgi:serine/threonine protein kinase